MKDESKKLEIDSLAIYFIVFNLIFFYSFFAPFPLSNLRFALFNLILIPITIRAINIIKKDLKLTNPIEKPKFLINEDIFEDDKNNLNIAGIGFKYNSKDKENQLEHVNHLKYELNLARKILPLFLIGIAFPIISHILLGSDLLSTGFTSAVTVPLITILYTFPVWNALLFNLFYLLILTCLFANCANLISYLVIFTMVLLFLIGLSLVQDLRFRQNFKLKNKLNLIKSIKKVFPNFAIFLSLFLIIDKVIEKENQSFFDHLLQAIPRSEKLLENELSPKPDLDDIKEEYLSGQNLEILNSLKYKGPKNIDLEMHRLKELIKNNQRKMNEIQRTMNRTRGESRELLKQELIKTKMDIDLANLALDKINTEQEDLSDSAFKKLKKVKSSSYKKENLKTLKEQLRTNEGKLNKLTQEFEQLTKRSQGNQDHQEGQGSYRQQNIIDKYKNLSHQRKKQLNKAQNNLNKQYQEMVKKLEPSKPAADENPASNLQKPKRKLTTMDKVLLAIKRGLLKIANALPYFLLLFAFVYFLQRLSQQKYIEEDDIKISAELKKEILKEMSEIPKTSSFVEEVKVKYRVFFSSIQKIYYENKMAPPPLILSSRDSQISLKLLRDISNDLGQIYTKIEFGNIFDFNSKEQRNFREQFHSFKKFVKRS